MTYMVISEHYIYCVLGNKYLITGVIFLHGLEYKYSSIVFVLRRCLPPFLLPLVNDHRKAAAVLPEAAHDVGMSPLAVEMRHYILVITNSRWRSNIRRSNQTEVYASKRPLKNGMEPHSIARLFHTKPISFKTVPVRVTRLP